MYIKFSFTENIVIVPQCWGGLIVSFPENFKPEILTELPANIISNQPVNFTRAKDGQPTNPYNEDSNSAHDYVENNYDYYYDCRNMKKDVIEKSLAKLFALHTDNQVSEIAGDGYPTNHPIIESFKSIIQQTVSELTPKLSNSVHALMPTVVAHSDHSNSEERFTHTNSK